MTKLFGFHSDSRGADEIRDLPIFFFFFFLSGHKGLPSGENAVGISFRKMIGTIIKVLCTLYTKPSLSLNRLISLYAGLVERKFKSFRELLGEQ